MNSNGFPTVPALLAALFITVWGASAHASAPATFPQIKADPERPKEAPARPRNTCRIEGRLYCSEYGTRYKERLSLVFVDGGNRYAMPLGEDDGSFAGTLPCGASYNMRLEFKEKGCDLGRLEIPEPGPEDKAPCSERVELYHPGSMLELVWEIRERGEAEVVVKINDNTPPPANH